MTHLPTTLLLSSEPSRAALSRVAELLNRGELDPLEALDRIGGSTLGFLAAALFADEHVDVSMPTWTVASAGETVGAMSDAVSRILRAYGAILVKQSGIQESFSPKSERGVNSSRGTHMRSLGEGDVATLLDGISIQAESRTIVLQGLIPQDPGRGNLHIYANRATIDIEAVFPNQRIFLRKSRATELWERALDTAPDPDRDVQLRNAADVAERFLVWASSRFTNVSEWNLEGEWDAEGSVFWIFQARPAPQDRPAAPSAPKPQYTTRYVWGTFDVEIDWRQSGRLISGIDELHALEEGSDRRQVLKQVESDIAVGRSVLVMDSSSAFRLSHESDHLVGSGSRSRYRYVHVPIDVLERWRGRERIRVWSDGDIARVEVLK